MKTVMFVDDEKLMLRSLKRIFTDNEHNYIFLGSAEEALEYLDGHVVDILCSDISMPNMDGFELFRAVKSKYPKVTRIALGNFSQKKDIEKMLRENLAGMFLFKPWNDKEVKASVENALEMKSALMTKEIIDFINKIDNLPSVPLLYNELIELVLEDKDIEEISKLIEQDQAITAKILRVANSAFYGRKTGSIIQAIMNIGLNNLKIIVLANSVFEGSNTDMKGIVKLWTHTINTNRFASAIYSECLNKNIPSMFASAGLLHDIGKVVLYYQYNKVYKTLINKSDEEDVSMASLEKEAFGVTHQDLGAYLLDWWELPFAYVEAAMFHHRPLDSRVVNKELVSVIHLANFYSNKYFKNGEDNLHLEEEVFERLNLKKEEVEAVTKKIMYVDICLN